MDGFEKFPGKSEIARREAVASTGFCPTCRKGLTTDQFATLFI